jgi:uncharacterized membrane protein YfcA
LIENFFLLFLIGIIAGIIGSMLGLGGGIIVSPVLTLSGLLPSQISATSLTAVASTSASSTLSYSIKRRIGYNIGIRLAFFAIPFSVFGALLSSDIDPSAFKLSFALMLIAISVYLLLGKPVIRKGSIRKDIRPLISNVLLYGGSSAAGFISSLFGVGGGIIFVPLLFTVKKLSMQRSIATSQLSILLTSLAGIMTHYFLFQHDYLLAGSIALGAVIGAQIGSLVALKVSERLLTVLFSFFLLIISFQLILDYLT